MPMWPILNYLHYRELMKTPRIKVSLQLRHVQTMATSSVPPHSLQLLRKRWIISTERASSLEVFCRVCVWPLVAMHGTLGLDLLQCACLWRSTVSPLDV